MPLPMGEGLSELLSIGYACRNLQPKTFGRGFDSRRLHSVNASDVKTSEAFFLHAPGSGCRRAVSGGPHPNPLPAGGGTKNVPRRAEGEGE
jgi:hypothetical protein